MKPQIQPIQSEEDYQAAMAEVAKLWGSKSGTPPGDRLDALVTLIDEYETQKDDYPLPAASK